MIRHEFKNTTLRLFNTKEAAEAIAKLHGGRFQVYFLNEASGFFFENEKGVFDEDGKVSKYMKKDEVADLFSGSHKV